LFIRASLLPLIRFLSLWLYANIAGISKSRREVGAVVNDEEVIVAVIFNSEA
jgi:hypothetical protein